MLSISSARMLASNARDHEFESGRQWNSLNSFEMKWNLPDSDIDVNFD